MTHLFAAPSSAGTPAAIGAGSLVSVTLALLVVLAAIFALTWLARRLRTFGMGANGALKVLATLPLGAKERAVLLKVGGTEILVGVAPGRVSTLHVLEQPIALDDGSARPAPSTFAALLKRSVGK